MPPHHWRLGSQLRPRSAATRCYTCTGVPGFPVLPGYCTFYKLKVWGSSVLRKPISTIFPTAFTHFISHFGNSCNISNFFIIIIFVMIICDLWPLMLLLKLFLGVINHSTWNELNQCVFSDCSTDWLFPISLPVLGPPHSPRHTMSKSGRSLTLQWPVSVLVKGRVACLSL